MSWAFTGDDNQPCWRPIIGLLSGDRVTTAFSPEVDAEVARSLKVVCETREFPDAEHNWMSVRAHSPLYS